MTEIRQEHHHPISAEDAKDVKPWRLPFWTEEPAWTSEKVDFDILSLRKKAKAAKAAQEEQEAQAAEPDTSVEEVEVEEVEIVLPTAEELETIRREAYNDGLQQGLIEGRQAGHKEGFEAGHKEAYEAAFAQGKNDGYAEGLRNGEETGLRKGQTEINTIVMRLERISENLLSTISERDQQLPQVLATLVRGICQQVLGYELANGSINILHYVERALAELPEGETNIQVFVGPDDIKHLEKSLAETGRSMSVKVDPQLPAGSCRVEGKHALAEYSSQEFSQQILDSVLAKMLDNSSDFPAEHEQPDLSIDATLAELMTQPLNMAAQTAQPLDLDASVAEPEQRADQQSDLNMEEVAQPISEAISEPIFEQHLGDVEQQAEQDNNQNLNPEQDFPHEPQ